MKDLRDLKDLKIHDVKPIGDEYTLDRLSILLPRRYDDRGVIPRSLSMLFNE